MKSKETTQATTEIKTEPVVPIATETRVESPVIEEKKESKVIAPEPAKEEPKPQPPYRKELDPKLSFEDRIIAFLDSRNTIEFVKMNDFLKSLYPLPKPNHPVAWMDQGAMKRLRILLEKMQAEGKIQIQSNAHHKLGTAYYPDTVTMKTEYHNLSSVVIDAKK